MGARSPGAGLTPHTIRGATTSDAAAIARIYNHYVEHSTATFDTEPKSVADRIEWIAERGATHPVFVTEIDGEVVAWGALSQYRSRNAWAGTAEVAVYVDVQRTGQGLGPALLERLVAEARRAGLHVLVSQIVADNVASLAMTQRAGFDRVGVMREVGNKFGEWLDVVIMQKTL